MHYTNYGTRATMTPQNEPIPGKPQVQNNAGGYSFVVDDMTRLHRFLLLGSSGGTYYIGERQLTKENLDVVERLVAQGKGIQVIDTLVQVSHEGRAVSNDPALFVLAYCTSVADATTRTYALSVLPKVARTGTHLLHFVHFVKQFRSWGRAYKRAIADWYQTKSVEQLAYQVVKYQQRDGFAQRDVLRLAHPKTDDPLRNSLYKWIVKGECDEHITSLSAINPFIEMPRETEPLALIWAYEQAKKAEDEKAVARLIKDYHLPREAVPTQHLKSVRVWEALLEDMPLEAMTRNLATMTKHGVLEPMGTFTQSVAMRLRNRDAIQKARLHPVKLLAALNTYQAGHGAKSDATWTPLREIIDALNDAFYLSFAEVEPTGKRLLIAIDVSGSMHGTQVNGIPNLSCHTGAAAMAMVTARAESRYHVMAYDTVPHPLHISPTQRLDDVVRTIEQAGNGGTDCSIPIQFALAQYLPVDAFVSYTDSESWFGRIGHVSQWLTRYRETMNLPHAKAVNVQMTSTHVTNLDPDDMLSLECAGFDTSTPAAISAFLAE